MSGTADLFCGVHIKIKVYLFKRTFEVCTNQIPKVSTGLRYRGFLWVTDKRNNPNMTSFEIAHINEHGVNVVVVFVDPAVARKSVEEQNAFAAGLQICANSANLAGNIAMVWPGGFWAPRNQHAFFGSPGGSYQALLFRINKKLSCE